jgi:hypothetical protein
MKIRLTIATLALFTAAVALQQGDIPPTNDPSHPGQPAWCQNTDSPEHKHNCECVDMNADPDQSGHCDKSQQESAKCKVYCRKTACKCKTKCDRQTSQIPSMPAIPARGVR